MCDWRVERGLQLERGGGVGRGRGLRWVEDARWREKIELDAAQLAALLGCAAPLLTGQLAYRSRWAGHLLRADFSGRLQELAIVFVHKGESSLLPAVGHLVRAGRLSRVPFVCGAAAVVRAAGPLASLRRGVAEREGQAGIAHALVSEPLRRSCSVDLDDNGLAWPALWFTCI